MVNGNAASPKTRRQKSKENLKTVADEQHEPSTSTDPEQKDNPELRKIAEQLQQKHGGTPSDIVCGYIPGMLQLILAQQQEMMASIADLQSKMSALELTSTEGQEKLSNKVEALSKRNLDYSNKITDMATSLASTAPNTSTSPQPQSTVNVQSTENSAINEAVIAFYRQDKKRHKTKEQCRAIKSTITLKWDDALKNRDKFYRNFIKNEKKSELYKDWTTNSPEYLPLKYRPKRIPGETPTFTEARINEAKLKYTNDCTLMKEYASTHKERFLKHDDEMKTEFRQLSENEDQYSMLIEQWTRETKKNESRAHQLWSRNETFLKKKKHEDEQSSNTNLADITWSEKLQNYRKRSNSGTVNNAFWQFPLQTGASYQYRYPDCNYRYPY